MPFDPTTAKPLVTGFDPSTAKLFKPSKTPAQELAQGAFNVSRMARLNTEEQQRPLRQSMGQVDTASDVGLGLLSSAVATPIAGLAGLFTGGNADVVDKVGSALTYQPRTQQGQDLSNAVAWPFEKLAQLGDYAGGNVAEQRGSPALGAGVNTAIQSLPALFLKGRGTPNASRSVAPSKGKPNAAPTSAGRKAGLGGVPPTIEELTTQSRAAYKRASDAGANIAPQSFGNLKNRVNVTLKKEGLDPTLHPKTTAALKRINDTKGAVSLDDFDTLRKIANDARGGVDPSDGRMAGRIIDELDDYAESIGSKDLTTGSPEAFAALKEARNLYSRKAKGEVIQELVRRAEISAPNFSASGVENALRTEFRGLAKNKNRMRRFNAEERAAIERVAKGGPMENALRMLGKFAPTGFFSTAFGGILTGATGGVGAIVPAAGAAARYGATRITRANALAAEEIMRRGPAPKPRRRNALEELTETTP